jgi:hypothetical protein
MVAMSQTNGCNLDYGTRDGSYCRDYTMVVRWRQRSGAARIARWRQTILARLSSSKVTHTLHR